MAMGTLLASASRTATTSAAAPTNVERYRGVMLILDVTTAVAAETLTLQVEVFDPASATWEAITGFAATAAEFSGEKVYVIYPGAVETAAIADQEVAGIPVPYRWRATITHSASGAWTYSLGYHDLP